MSVLSIAGKIVIGGLAALGATSLLGLVLIRAENNRLGSGNRVRRLGSGRKAPRGVSGNKPKAKPKAKAKAKPVAVGKVKPKAKLALVKA